ncbi:DEAD/DEAH box helicase [Candidatus Woesearchaeota archaeon]|nr:DEAD/DEAH box helicase [Candidatus Woesearchaeota archaeon]
MIKNFVPRLYQQTIFATAAAKNTLVVLPTGLGKTNIFLMLAAHRLQLYPKSKILLIGPTKPLIDQYYAVFLKNFEIPEEKMAIFTGEVAPEKRAEFWKQATLLFSTPQGLENDIINNRIDLSAVSLLGFDEAHRAIGDYSYVWLAEQYQKRANFPRIIGLTASPGSELEKIEEVCKNLFIQDIEVRTDTDPDVAEYVQEIQIDWVKVKLPEEFKGVQLELTAFLHDRMKKLQEWGILQRKEEDFKFISKTDLLAMQAQLRGRTASGERDFAVWNGISVLAEIMKVQHALELLETQGINALHAYLHKLQKEGVSSKTKAIKHIISDLHFRTAVFKAEKLFQQKIEHPKLTELKGIITREFGKKNDCKIIVFNEYRDNAFDIVEELNKLPGIKAALFVGQTKKGDTGLSQKGQKEMLEKFSAGEFNVLVSTSIGEEGLDIPQVDLVIFFEPIPSAIRTIQRRGRTGRQEEGRVIVLMALDTRDVGYKWSAHHKEKRMHRTLAQLKKKMTIQFPAATPSLEKFIPAGEKIKIFVDHREKGSKVIKELIEMGAILHVQALEHADYLLSSEVGVEFKTSEDFVNSLIDGRLLGQLRELKEKFIRPLVLVEGEQDIYAVRNVHPNAIRGMLATIAADYGIPVLFTRNPQESAGLLYAIAKRQQESGRGDFALHNDKPSQSLSDIQEFIVSAFPGVGSSMARPILRRFKTLKNFINASEEELKDVEKIGDVKAKRIKEITDKEYSF